MNLESTLRARRDSGHKLLVAYVTGGLPVGGGETWIEVVRAVAAAGADAVEVGIPFSDPVMDGPVIQEASRLALEAGTTPRGLLAELAGAGGGAGGMGVPLAVMTYFNVVHAFGLDRFAQSLSRSGVDGAIIPDLPLDEAGPWMAEAVGHRVETVMLAAPTTPDERLVAICAASSGFVYGVGLMGVTGVRDSLAASALALAKRLKAVTDKPVLIGVGVSDAAQAVEACSEADGVVIGSALMRRLLEGAGSSGVAELIAEVRAALEAG